MCDTFVALGNATQDGSVIFGKNSDREPNEAQELIMIPHSKHEENAQRVAIFLQNQPNVIDVFFPGLENHPGHSIAKKQMTGFGGIVSFRIRGGLNEANSFFKKLTVFQLADSLGGVESLANYSALMTHEAFPPELRKKIGVTENLIRLSIGIEHIDDIKADLEQALAAAN